MSELQKNKESIASDIDRLSKGISEAKNRYLAAITAGKNAEAQSYVDMARRLRDQAKVLENQYSNLEAEEEKPNLERVQALTKELRKPIVNPAPNYMGMGGRGGMGIPAPNYSGPSVEQQKATKRESIAQLFKAPVGEGGVVAEQLPAGVRGAVGALPTPESELEYLQKTYPDANITPMTVGNSTQFLIKTKDRKVFTTLDMGLAGAAGAAAVEVPIVLGSTAAGIGTALATKSPITGTSAATAVEAGLGVAADTAVRKYLGMDANIGESAVRRGSQAAIGGALGVVGDVAVPTIRAFRVPSNAPNFVREELVESAENVGLPGAVPSGSQFGTTGITGAQELAGDFPKSRLGGKLRTNQLELVKAFDPFRKMATTTAGDYASAAINQGQKRRELSTLIAQNTNQNVTIVDGAVQRLLEPAAKANADELGGTIRGAIQQLDAETARFTGDQYARMEQIADDAGFQISAQEMLDKIPQIKRELNSAGFTDVNAVNGLEDKLRARRGAPIKIAEVKRELSSLNKLMSGTTNLLERSRLEGRIQDATNNLRDLEAINRPLNFKDFNELVKSFGNLRSDVSVGGTTKDVFGTQISNELSLLRREIFKGYSVTDPTSGLTRNLADEFQIAADAVGKRNDMQKNTLGSILKEAGGESVATQRDVVRIAMEDPETMDRVLRASQDLGPNAEKAIREGMQVQYMQDIGMGRQGKIDRLNYDQGKLDILFGANSPNIARGLDALNEKLSRIKRATISNITRDDLTALSSALSKRERNELAAQIVKREKLKEQENELVASKIYEFAEEGNFQQIDPDLLSGAIFGSLTERQTKIAMAQLSKASPDARNLFKRDFMRMFLDRYRGGTPTAAPPYFELFDVDKFLLDYGTRRNPTELGKKINIVLGQDSGTTVHDIARLYQGNTPVAPSKTTTNLRVIASPKNVNIIAPISKLTLTARNRLLAEALVNESSSNSVRNALARNALPGDVNDAFLKMYQSAFTTRQGLMGLARLTADDEELSYELEQAAREFEEKEKAKSTLKVK